MDLLNKAAEKLVRSDFNIECCIEFIQKFALALHDCASKQVPHLANVASRCFNSNSTSKGKEDTSSFVAYINAMKGHVKFPDKETLVTQFETVCDRLQVNKK